LRKYFVSLDGFKFSGINAFARGCSGGGADLHGGAAANGASAGSPGWRGAIAIIPPPAAGAGAVRART